MRERRGRERIFEIDPVKRPKGRFLRRIISKYVRWVEAFGYLFCAAVATGIVWCWVHTVDEVAKEKEVGKSLIKPYEEPLVHAKDAIVTGVAAKEWQRVANLAAVVEICDDAEWVRRYRAIQGLDDLAKKLRDLEKEGPLAAHLAKQATDAEKEVEAWNKGDGKKGPRVQLRAPVEGDVTGAEVALGKFFKAGDAICKIVNFNDLRLTVKLSGTNVERVRVGMPAKIKVTPDYGLGCVVRADTKLGWFESARLQFNYVLDGKEVKSFLLDWWKRHPVVSPDDTKQSVALTPTEVEECEVVCALRTDALSPAEAAKVPETFYLEVDPIASENPVHGIVIEGKHTGTYTTNYLDPPVREELKRRLMEAVKGKEAQPKGKAGEPVLRIEGVNSIHTYLKIKAAVADITLEESKRAKEKDKGKEQKKIPVAIMDQRVVADGEWRLRRAGMDERFALAAATGIEVDRGDRFFEGSVRIDSPSSDLVMKVKEAYQKSPAAYLKAKVEVVVGECRLAMLLFRQ